MNDDLIRADMALVARGLAPSRQRARALIDAGLVRVNGVTLDKPSKKVDPADEICLVGRDHPYVSRGGLKLEAALRDFDVSAEGQVCLDVGASTGGFTDVLLQHGARRVYAVDVGTGQLHESLRRDERVVVMEQTNARTLQRDRFPQLPTLAVMDVSFISIRLILPALFSLLGENGRVITLIKPQFEAGRSGVGKGGIVRQAATHRQVLGQIADFPISLGWCLRALEISPITGGDGNIEFLADLMPLSRCTCPIGPDTIDRVVDGAHARAL